MTDPRSITLPDGTVLRIGDRIPMEKPKLRVRPSCNADDPSTAGVFGRGKGGR